MVQRIALASLLLYACLAFGAMAQAQTEPQLAPTLTLRLASRVLQQGDVVIARAVIEDAPALPATLAGEFAGEPMPLVTDAKGEPGSYIGLMGIEPLLATGNYTVVVTATLENGLILTATAPLALRSGGYITERVKLPTKLTYTIEPMASAAEERQLREVYRQFTPEQTWSGVFRLPIRGRVVSGYGTHRIYNGVDLGTFHSGYDISARAGLTVSAAAPGRVVFVEKLIVRGNMVVVDHGRGVFTGYAHMRAVSVEVGQRVETGDKIGEVGTTGRSQGNHLHFELAVGGHPVEPEYWTRIALP